MADQRRIPFFNYPDIYISKKRQFLEIIDDVCSRGAFIMQKDLERFEQNLAKFLGVRYAFGVADGTMALIMAVKACGFQPGDEIIVPSHTMAASVASIHHNGCIPVLADCGPDHLIDPKSVAARVTSRTKGIMPVQLNGRTADMDALNQLAMEHDLVIIEDSAQALGSKYKGNYAGTFGKAGTFSFYPAKVLGCFGDGGAIVTNDDQVADQVRLLRDHGRDEASGDVLLFGYNSRLDNIQAAILDFQLTHYSQVMARRREIASLYHNALCNLKQLHLPPKPEQHGDHYDIFQNYEIEAERRDHLRDFLTKNGIGTILQWGGKTMHQFKKLKLNADCPYCEAMTSRFLLLPLNMSLSNEDIEYICEAIHDFYA